MYNTTPSWPTPSNLTAFFIERDHTQLFHLSNFICKIQAILYCALLITLHTLHIAISLHSNWLIFKSILQFASMNSCIKYHLFKWFYFLIYPTPCIYVLHIDSRIITDWFLSFYCYLVSWTRVPNFIWLIRSSSVCLPPFWPLCIYYI